MARVREDECQACESQDDDTAGCGAHGLDGHPADGEIRRGALHWQKGWTFEPMGDGWVRLSRYSDGVSTAAAIPPEAWAAIVAHVSPEIALEEGNTQ